MTTKTSNGSASESFALIAPELPGNPYTAPKAKPMASPISTQLPVSLYPSNMLTGELRANINKKWEACWPINMLRPLVLLDLLSYLLFIKKLEERQLVTEKRPEIFGNLTQTKEKDELSWSSFKDMDAQSMHNLFTQEKGIPYLLKNYGQTNLQYSLFVKEPSILTPTATVLANIVDIIKIMEAEGKDTRAFIFEYLLNKDEITAQNGQVYAPDYIVKLAVAMMQPTPEDIIGDPSAGNGCFLVNCALYIANKNFAAIPNLRHDPVGDIYKGIESDLIQLRIGAMNMILHGIDDPKLQGLNVFSRANLSLREQPTLIFSNLFFDGTSDKVAAKSNNLQTEARRPEVSFLTLILKSLKSSGRAAVIIREIVLYDNLTEIKAIRRQIIDEHKLEAVITLPVKTGSLFSGACILIFTKPAASTTDKVWFYKMETRKEGISKKDTDSIQPGINELPSFMEECDVPDILNRWKNEKEEAGRKRTDKSFYVSIDEIRANNYNLSFNEYRKVSKEPEHPGINIPHTYKKIEPVKAIPPKSQRLPINIKLPAQLVASIKKSPRIIGSVVVFCLVVMAFYFIFSKTKNDPGTSAITKNSVSPAKTKEVPPAHKPVRNTPPGMLTAEQIRAILKDTTGILHFQSQPVALATHTGRVKVSNKNSRQVTLPGKTPLPVPSQNNLKAQYTVADTTFFHDQPNAGSRRKSYLDPLNKNILTPIQEKNGFIFIMYTNRFGRTSKGWIDKKDLRLVR